MRSIIFALVFLLLPTPAIAKGHLWVVMTHFERVWDRLDVLEAAPSTPAGPQVYDAEGFQVGQLLDAHNVLLEGFSIGVTHAGFVGKNVIFYFEANDCTGQAHVGDHELTPVNLTPRNVIDNSGVLWSEVDTGSPNLTNETIVSELRNGTCQTYSPWPVNNNTQAVDPILDLSDFVAPFELR